MRDDVTQDVQAWLAEVAASGTAPVLGRRDRPDDAILDALDRVGALIRLPGDILVVKRPDDSEAEAVRRSYWAIVEALLANYEPAVVERDSAVRILVGDETPSPVLRVRNGRNASKFESRLPGDLRLVVAAGHVDSERVVRRAVAGATIALDDPARILTGLELRFLRDSLPAVSLWLKSLVLSRASVEAAYQEHSRPVVLRRLAHVAEDAGNARLADMLADVVESNQNVRIGRGRTGVGRELVVPREIGETRTTRRPWLDRLDVHFRIFRDQIQGAVQELGVHRPDIPRSELLRQAREAKAEDVYHSTSIEGYRIRPEDVSVLLGGSPPGALSEADLRSAMAVQGYSRAFDRLLDRIEESEDLSVDTGLVLDLYVDLFSPSVEAGVTEAEVLRGWRSTPVFIRGTRYVPPAAAHVPDMMNLLMERLPTVSSIPTRAALAHLIFVSIHPFSDGNGRVGRLLMNAILSGAGWPWLTIRESERRAYFKALEQAQLDADAHPFGRLLFERDRAGRAR